MNIASCLYEGEVRHRRFDVVPHEFRFRLFLMYVDLEGLPELFRGRWLWSAHRPNVAWFRRGDHLGPADLSLDEAVRRLVQSRTGRRPSGPIRLLTHFRYFGLLINPISLYYCFGSRGELEAVVADVTNTPWGERHCYVLDASACATERVLATQPKELHVSPFFGMDHEYTFTIAPPGESLVVHIENRRTTGPHEPPLFDATLTLRRREITAASLVRVLCRYPFMTGQVYAGIYWQAFRLWRKGVPFHAHPAQTAAGDAASRADPARLPIEEVHDAPMNFPT